MIFLPLLVANLTIGYSLRLIHLFPAVPQFKTLSFNPQYHLLASVYKFSTPAVVESPTKILRMIKR